MVFFVSTASSFSHAENSTRSEKKKRANLKLFNGRIIFCQINDSRADKLEIRALRNLGYTSEVKPDL